MATASPWRRSQSGWSAWRALQRVGQGVAVVEDDAAAALALVLGHDRRLDAGAARHLLLDGLVRRGGVAQEGVLGDFASAAGPFAGRERRKRLGVAQHGVGLPEGAHEVLALGQVDAVLPPMAASTWARSEVATLR